MHYDPGTLLTVIPYRREQRSVSLVSSLKSSLIMPPFVKVGVLNLAHVHTHHSTVPNSLKKRSDSFFSPLIYILSHLLLSGRNIWNHQPYRFALLLQNMKTRQCFMAWGSIPGSHVFSIIMYVTEPCSIYKTNCDSDMFYLLEWPWLRHVLFIRMTVTQPCPIIIMNVTQTSSIY